MTETNQTADELLPAEINGESHRVAAILNGLSLDELAEIKVSAMALVVKINTLLPKTGAVVVRGCANEGK